MARNWRYNNGSNRTNQTPHNNGQYNNASFNNGTSNNTPLNKGPQNGNQYPRGPRNTNFYNRVSRNDHNSYNSRNINPNNNYNRRNNFNNGNSNSVNNGNANGNANSNAQRPILQSSSPDERQPEGRFTINNTVVTHPAPRTPALDTSGPKKQASGKPEDRSRLEQNICDYYGIGSLKDLLKNPSHAPEEWDNLLLNKICCLRDHQVSLQELRDGIHNQVRERIRKSSKRSDKPVKPYLLPQDLVALIKEVEKANTEQSEPEVAITNPTPHKNKTKTTPSTGPKKRMSSSAGLVSEQASSSKRRRRVYISPEPPSDDTDAESVPSVTTLVTDAEFAEQLRKMQQRVARVRDIKRELMGALAAFEEDGEILERMAERMTRHDT